VPFGDGHLQLFPILQPNVQAGVSRFPVNGHESEIVVEANKRLSLLHSPQVVGEGSQLGGAAFQFLSKGLFWEVEAKGQHLRYCV